MFTVLFTYLIVKDQIEPQGLFVSMIFDTLVILGSVGIVMSHQS